MKTWQFWVLIILVLLIIVVVIYAVSVKAAATVIAANPNSIHLDASGYASSAPPQKP